MNKGKRTRDARRRLRENSSNHRCAAASSRRRKFSTSIYAFGVTKADTAGKGESIARQKIFGDVGRRPYNAYTYIYIFRPRIACASTASASGCNPISRDGLSREQSARLRMHRRNAGVVCTHLALIYDGKTQLRKLFTASYILATNAAGFATYTRTISLPPRTRVYI